jgi:predicted phage terminase large subunit-like protein
MAQQRIKTEARRWNIVACGRRFGKTALGIDVGIEAALPGYPVGWFAPTYRLLAEVWRELRLILAPLTVHKSETEHRLELVGGGVIDCWSLDGPDSGRGRKYKRVVIDEAAIVPHLEDAWEQSIRPTLTDLVGDAWFLSTPKGFNYFHTLWNRGISPEYPEYASWQMPSSANPFLPPKELEAARAEVLERVYRQEYEASFVDDASMVFDRSWWMGQNRYDPTDAFMPAKVIARWISWDTGLKDKDENAYTACVVGELLPDYRLMIRDVWRGRPIFPELPAVIAQVAKQYGDGKTRAILIEDKASGTSAYQTLMAGADREVARALVPFMPSGDKIQRSEQAAVWARNGCVLLPEPGPKVPWLLDFEEELFAFPQTEFKDQADALAQLILYCENILAEGWRVRGGN